MSGAIWLLSGAPGAGKTTTARALCACYPRALHIPVDDLRDFVLSGYASPLDEPWTEEATLQFRLAETTASRMAALYADAGFVVVIDSVVREADLEKFRPHFAEHVLHKVLLSPRVELSIARNQARRSASYEPAKLERRIRPIDEQLRAGCRPEDGWVVVDTTDLTPDEVVAQLVQRFGKASESATT